MPLMMEDISTDSDVEIRSIIGQACMAAPLPRLDSLPQPRTKGEHFSMMISSLKEQHEQVRANILAQTPGSALSQDSTFHRQEQQFSALLNSTPNNSFIHLLEEPNDSSRGDRYVGPKRPNDVYSKPLPTTQDAPMHPMVYGLLKITKALEIYNEHARKELRNLEEEHDKLRRTGEAKVPIDRIKPVGLEGRRSSETDMRGPGSRFPSGPASIPTNGTGEPLNAPASAVNRSRDPRLKGR